jgi:HAMP domain-containing protein
MPPVGDPEGRPGPNRHGRGWTLSRRLAALIAVLLVASAIVTTVSVFQSVQSTMLEESSQSVDNTHASVSELIAQEYGNARAFRNSTLNQRKAGLADVASPIATALDTLRAQVDAGTLDETVAQDAALQMLKSIRFGNDDYFFTYDRDMTAISHPDANFEGRNLIDLQDADGTYVLREIRRVALDLGGGFVPYQWVRLDADEASPKIGYVFHYEPWDWIIGTGVYVDDIDAAADRRLDAARTNLSQALADIDFQSDGFFFILDEAGDVVVAPAGTDLSGLSGTPEGAALTERLVDAAPTTGTATVTVEGALGQGAPREWVTKVSSFAPLGWVLVSAVPGEDLTEPGRILALQQVGLAVVVLLIGLVAGLLMSRRIARPVEDVTQAATALAEDRFEPAMLDKAADRTDEVGTLARTFRRMATEVIERERALRDQVTRLTVEIDATRREAAVREIVETDFFADLSAKAADMRRRVRGEDQPD